MVDVRTRSHCSHPPSLWRLGPPGQGQDSILAPAMSSVYGARPSVASSPLLNVLARHGATLSNPPLASLRAGWLFTTNDVEARWSRPRRTGGPVSGEQVVRRWRTGGPIFVANKYSTTRV